MNTELTKPMETAVRRPARLGARSLAVPALAALTLGVLVLSGAAPAAATDTATAPLDRRVSVDLDHVKPAAAFHTLAGLAGLTSSVEAAVKEPITVRLENVRVRTLLDAVCESIGCRWEVAGNPAALHVTAVPGGEPKPQPAQIGLRDPVQLKVASVDVRELLRTFANLLDADLQADPAVQGKVTLDAEGVALKQALDSVCQQAACAWALTGGEDGARRVLKVSAKKP